MSNKIIYYLPENDRLEFEGISPKYVPTIESRDYIWFFDFSYQWIKCKFFWLWSSTYVQLYIKQDFESTYSNCEASINIRYTYYIFVQCFGSGFFFGFGSDFFSESGSRLAKNMDPIRKNPDTDPWKKHSKTWVKVKNFYISYLAL